jgi:prepilin-type N-terminal cleavage/methylation domain-containing protein
MGEIYKVKSQKQLGQMVQRKKANQGFTIVEVLIASSILSIAILGGVTLQSSVMTNTRRTNDKAFASEKVLQMFEEIRSHTEGNQEKFDTSLASYSDGANYNYVLTSERFTTNPSDPLSKNRMINSKWQYVRQIQIEPLPNDEYARRVSVTMWYADANGQPVNKDRPLAAIAGILKTNIPRTPPTQVYDFFVISIANCPAWWSNLYDFKPAYDAVFGDLEFRNPGLKLRKRYISNLAYGRDPFYLPHTNTENTADNSVLPWAYYYPGKVNVTNIPPSNVVKEDFAFKQINTRIRGDAPTTASGAIDTSKIFHLADRNDRTKFRPAAMADEHNHGLRAPIERAMERRLRALAGTITKNDITANPDLANVQEAMREPTLVSFLDGMNRGEYRNSMLSNMHAELTPIPPVVNYSYAAKLPKDERDTANTDKFAHKRVVSHPEQLFYTNGDTTTPMRWRVYAYTMPHYARPLDNDANDILRGPETKLQDIIPQINVFFPTDGKGRNSAAPASPGYLNNPDFDPSTTFQGNEQDALRPEKIIGHEGLQYQKRRTASHWVDEHTKLKGASFNGSGAWNITDITNPATQLGNLKARYLVSTNKDIFYEDESATGANNQHVQLIGDVLAYGNNGGKIWIAFENNQPLATTAISPVNTPNTAAYQNLVGEFIRVKASRNSGAADPDELETFQVLEAVTGKAGTSLNTVTTANSSNWKRGILAGGSTATGGIVTNLTSANVTALNNANAIFLRINRLPAHDHIAAERVTRHRDFDVAYNPDSIFGATRKGISINLYNTPTWHTQNNAGSGIYTGLPEARRLYGLEYIPAPVNNGNVTSPTVAYSDDFFTDLTDTTPNASVYSRTGQAANSDGLALRARNTARWTVSIKPTSAYVGTNLDSQTIAAETRIIGKQALKDLQSTETNAYLQDGVAGDGDPFQPDDAATPSVNENEIRRLNLYNNSISYAYRGTSFESAVPKSEQSQYMGDPRHMPYADIKARGSYNTSFFCPKQTGSENCDSGNIGFGFRDYAFLDNATNAHTPTDDMGGYDGYTTKGNYGGLTDIDVDVHKAFSMYIEGILKSNSIYNTIAGYTNYIISLGGGVGQRGDHTYAYTMKNSPWVTSSSTTVTNNSEDNTVIAERGNQGRLRFITAISPSSSNIQNQRKRWSGFHYLGELFPDELYDFWKENGNLPNATYTNAQELDLNKDGTAEPAPTTKNGSALRFYRARYSETPYFLGRRDRITHEGAIADFYNGSSNPSNESHRIKHSTRGGQGWLQGNATAAGRFLSDAFNLSLPETIKSTRSFCISSGSCFNPDGSTSSEYQTQFMRERRNTIKYINLTGPSKGTLTNTASENTTFYRYHDGTSTSPTVNSASSLIKISRDAVTSGGVAVPADPNLVGYAVINGLDQGQLFGAQSLSRLAQAATLQGFLEGGDRNIPGAATGRIVLLPRLELTTPDANKIQTIGNVNVAFKADWLRWDLRKYSPSYPDNWYDSVPIQFNAMYSNDNGAKWYYVNTNTEVTEENKGKYNTTEQLLGSASYVMSTPQQNWNFNWNASTLPEGDYLLRVEVYRQGYDVGYSYHQLFLTFK